jgi:hypothetical protein
MARRFGLVGCSGLPNREQPSGRQTAKTSTMNTVTNLYQSADRLKYKKPRSWLNKTPEFHLVKIWPSSLIEKAQELYP